jgi:hypothetical protein
MDDSSIHDIIIIEKTASYLPLILVVLLLCGIAYIINNIIGASRTKEGWAEIRCQPHIMPFASLYGHDTAENFNYCMTNMFNKKGATAFAPMYKMMGFFIGIINTLIENAKGLQLQVATLVGGITTVFKEFGQRLSQFMFRIRMTAMRLQMLMNRVYGSMFALLYMGMSGVSAVSNLADSSVVKFLNFFCFDPETLIQVKNRGLIAVKDAAIGDIIMGGCESKITAVHQFIGDGQPVVKLGPITVSTNHYVLYNGTYILAGDHPDAVPAGDWAGKFICFNTDNHMIPIGPYIFRDYDETHDGDYAGTVYSHRSLNGSVPCEKEIRKTVELLYGEGPCIAADVRIKMADGVKTASQIQLGDKIYAPNSSGAATVIGIIKQNCTNYCEIDGARISAATLQWNSQWGRVHSLNDIYKNTADDIWYGFIISPSSTIVLENGTILRDSMEVLSPFTEDAYSEALKRM